MRFYLDADLSPRVASLARDFFGIDVVSCHDEGARRAQDEQILLQATAQERCLVTNNRTDFLQWDIRFQERGRSHCGMLFTTATMSLRDAYQLARALAYYHHTIHPAPFTPGLVDWLHRPPDDWRPPGAAGG
ncbi:MAG: DUF5615 family PIN-like protein [Dehalococcoidia bacterium]